MISHKAPRCMLSYNRLRAAKVGFWLCPDKPETRSPDPQPCERDKTLNPTPRALMFFSSKSFKMSCRCLQCFEVRGLALGLFLDESKGASFGILREGADRRMQRSLCCVLKHSQKRQHDNIPLFRGVNEYLHYVGGVPYYIHILPFSNY